MAIGSNYPVPVAVNGFECRNCTDVDYAKKHIDPADPKAGPYGVNASTNAGDRGSAVNLSGVLVQPASTTGGEHGQPRSTASQALGTRVDVSV